MNAELKIDNKTYLVDFSKCYDISIPLNFNGNQPNTYGVDCASSKPYTDDQFIGDRRKGGPCNFEIYKLIPHCNGTHTECIGHITEERISILDSLNDIMISSTLITITPSITNELYIPNLNSEDLVITKKDLCKVMDRIPSHLLKGLIIRTLPNSCAKKSQDYMKIPPAFFSIEAMQYIVSKGVEHLLVDTPSVDRLFDEGNLSAHNIFWDTKKKKYNSNTKHKTITEMIFVDNHIEDGSYLLNLQIPAFVSDAAPSRPIIFKLNDI